MFTRCFTCLGCMKLTKQTLKFLHLLFGVCNHDASEQYSLLQGYSHLKTAQAAHKTFNFMPCKPCLTVITYASPFNYLKSPQTTTSPTLVHTGLHQPGCLSAESMQHGYKQCFEQHTYQHMLQTHLKITTSLQSCHVADKFFACQ